MQRHRVPSCHAVINAVNLKSGRKGKTGSRHLHAAGRQLAAVFQLPVQNPRGGSLNPSSNPWDQCNAMLVGRNHYTQLTTSLSCYVGEPVGGPYSKPI